MFHRVGIGQGAFKGLRRNFRIIGTLAGADQTR